MANSLIDGDGKLNVKNYNEKVRKQQEIFGKIDSAMATLELLPAFSESILKRPYSDSPLGLLFNIIKVLGVSEETLKEWIVEILVYVLPTVEIGIKASLLANIKSLISCNADPRIPLRFRKKASRSVYTSILTNVENAGNKRGIDINIDAIDPEGLLDLSPFTEPGLTYYFGCTDDSVHDTAIKKVVSKYDDGLNIDTKKVIGDGNSRTAKLVRADDFNAFLWYVIHKGNKQTPSRVTIQNGKFIVDGDDLQYAIQAGVSGLLGTIEISAPNGYESNIIAGNTFYDSNNANYIAICIESKIDQNENSTTYGKITGNTIVPVSSDWYSCNWYVDKSNYYASNLGVKSRKPRDYTKEKAICNLRFYQEYDYMGREIPGAPNNLRFTILPKPYVLLPSIDTEDTEENPGKLHVQWRPIRLLFDANGNADQKGKFSLISETYDLQPTLRNKRTGGENTIYDVYGIIEGGEHIKGGELYVNIKTGRYYLKNVTNLSSILVECYPGLTVYEFNYDYIMGMKLFDPKVVCQRIFDNAENPYYDAHFSLTLNKTKNKKNRYPFIEGKQRVIEIVRTILEEDEDEINDCFYHFSNEQYDEMLKKTEEIRYRQMPYNQGYNEGESIDFTEVTKILEEYPSNGSEEEQKEVIRKALNRACDILNSRKNITTPSDRSTTNIDFLTDILQQLVAAIVDAVLSPKVLMLLMVNNALIESQPEEPFNTEALMRILKNVIKSLVREVRDLIMKKLLDYIIEYLTPLALQIQARVFSEQFAAYMAIIKLLLGWFNKGLETVGRLSSILSSMVSKLKNRYGSNADYGDITEIDLPSILDEVNYADIYPSDIKDKEPVNNNC
jgi:hypothetical protein